MYAKASQNWTENSLAYFLDTNSSFVYEQYFSDQDASTVWVV